jgi:hypothetical protein
MILSIFSVYDKKAEAYLQPFFAPTKASAERSFRNAINDNDHTFNCNPDDYSLVYIGEFDDSNCDIITDDKLDTVITGRECTNPVDLKIAK